MKKSAIIFVLIISLGFASAASVTYSGGTVSITGAVDLYGYELKFDSTSGSVTGVNANNFLTGTTSSSYSSRGDYDYVYESKMDSTQTGISGDGTLCTITSTGTIVLKEYLLIAADGSEDEHNCGDGTCEANLAETCSTCAADCGACDGDGDDDGGGGGSGSIATATTQISRDIIVVPKELSISVISGEEQEEQITIANNELEEISLTLETSGDLAGIISFNKDSFTLKAGEQETVTLKVFVEESGLFVGEILIKKGNVIVQKVPIIVNVRSENFLFDASISLLEGYRIISAGENLFAEINLLQVGPQEKIDIVVNYVIKDYLGNIYLEDSETFSVLGEKNFKKEFFVADLLPTGKYVLGMEILYPGAFATSSTQFEVVGKEKLDVMKIGIIAAAAAFIIAVMAIVWAFRERKSLKKKRK